VHYIWLIEQQSKVCIEVCFVYRHLVLPANLGFFIKNGEQVIKVDLVWPGYGKRIFLSFVMCIAN
jgi:hypothetical protein